MKKLFLLCAAIAVAAMVSAQDLTGRWTIEEIEEGIYYEAALNLFDQDRAVLTMSSLTIIDEESGTTLLLEIESPGSWTATDTSVVYILDKKSGLQCRASFPGPEEVRREQLPRGLRKYLTKMEKEMKKEFTKELKKDPVATFIISEENGETVLIGDDSEHSIYRRQQ